MTPITVAIRGIGMSPEDFAKEKLGLKYSTFRYRIRVGHLTLDDYHRILFYTGKTFEELFPNPYRQVLIPVPMPNPAGPGLAIPPPPVEPPPAVPDDGHPEAPEAPEDHEFKPIPITLPIDRGDDL